MADFKTTNIYGDIYVNNKVGINTNVPATRLQIGQLSPTASTEGLQFGDDTSARLHRINTGHIRATGGISSATFLIADNYLQTNNNLIYPAAPSSTQRLAVGNTAQNGWIDGITIAPGGIVTVYSDLFVNNQLQVKNDNPTITLRDTNHSSSFIHVNGNTFYVLCGPPNAAFGEWAIAANGRWPMELNLTNNNATFGGNLDAMSFTGSGSGLFGVAPNLTVGTATIANSLNTSNNYQVNSLGIGMAGSGTAGRLSLNQAGVRSWSITPSGGRLVFEAGDGLGSAIFACPVTASIFVGAGTGLTGTAANLSVGYATSAGTATDSTKLPLTGGTLTGQLNINHSASTSILRLYNAGSTIWSLGVGDSSGTNFNISADFGSILINKSTGNLVRSGSGFFNYYTYHREDITSLSSSATNLVQPLGTFDGPNIVNAPTSGWYNYFSSTHSNYLTSLIANLHRTARWYVGYKEGPGGTPTNPNWYELVHTGFTGTVSGLTAATASYANALNPANSYTGVNFTATGYFQTNLGNIKSDTSFTLLTTSNGAQSVSTKGILLGTSYDTSPGANEIRTTNNTSLYLNARGTGDIQFQTADTLKMMLLNNGNVGIGTTSPTGKLVVIGDDVYNYTKSSVPTAIIADDDVEFLIGSTDNIVGEEITLRLGTVLNTYYTYGAYIKAIQGSGVDYYKLAFGTSNGAAATTKMTIDHTGNVGIGTTVPSSPLHVYSSDSRYLTFSSTGQLTLQRNVLSTNAATPQLTIINTQGSDAGTGRGVGIQLDLGYGGSASTVGTAARGARIATLGETVYSSTSTTQNASLVFFTSTTGSLSEKLRIRSDGSISPITVSSTTAGATLIKADGTNGTVFSVIDDLSDSLLSVNNAAGLPVFEVFADDRIVAGQYGQNDFIIVNNKVGIGTNNPIAELHVTSSTSIPSALFLGGNVGIGTTNPVYRLQVSGQTYLNNGTSNALQIQTVVADTTTRDAIYLYEDSGAATGRQAISWYNGNQSYYKARLWTEVGGGYNATQFGIDVADDARTVATRLLIRNGNVGIGTTLPQALLHVNGLISGSSFSGAGTGLTGTAANLSIGGSAGSCTGNAATATILQTARNIGGVSFNGSADINLPGVNTAGNQNTSGNAATATAATTARRIDDASRTAFTVGGNKDNYYPVIFNIGSGATALQYSEFVIERGGYEEPGYTFAGGNTFSTLNIRFSCKSNGWGYGASYENVEMHGYTTQLVANWEQMSEASKLIVWLRGATIYYFWNVVANTTLHDGNSGGTSLTLAQAPYYSYTYTSTATVQAKAQYGKYVNSSTGIPGLYVAGRILAEGFFSGPGTGLTGTAANLTAGAANSVAWTNVSGRPTNVSTFTNDSGYLTSVINITGNAGTVTNGVYTTGNQTIAGNKTFTGTSTITGSIESVAVRETFAAITTSATVSIDLSTATVFNLSFTGTISKFNITNVNTAKVNSFTLISAPGAGAATISWTFQTNGLNEANVKWAGSAPTATTTTNRWDIFSFVYNGSAWYGFTGGLNYV